MQEGVAIFGLLVMLFVSVISAAIGIAIGGGIYMLACLLYNLLSENLSSKSGPAPMSPPSSGWSPGGYAGPGGNPYAAPQTVAKNYVRRSSKNNVPMPSYPTSLLIIFLSSLSVFGLWICLFLALLGVATIAKSPALASLVMLAGILLIVAGAFCITSALGSKYLPTSFGKASLITLLFYAIYFVIWFFLAITFGSFAAVFR